MFFVYEFEMQIKNGLVGQLNTILIICRGQNQTGNTDNDGASSTLRRPSNTISRRGLDRVATVYVKRDGHTPNT